jgi:glycosyltransferase involved in cell wall biosynthesis
MRVAVVAEQLRRPAPGGIGTYVRGLLQGVRELGAEAPDVAAWTSRLPSPLATRLWDRGRLRGPAGIDVMHAPSLAFPAPRAPLVVTVHDVAWRAGYGVSDRGHRWHEASLERARRAGAVLLAPDDDVATALRADGAADVRQLDGPLYGCDHLPAPDEAAAAAALAGLGVEGPFLLSVSTLEPRKNLPRLLDAFSLARRQLGDEWRLVVVGFTGWGPELAPVPDVVVAGRQPDATLAGLYARAAAVAYVPLLEGFGLPAVEAMRAGAPVVASPVPSTAGAAHEVDPLDVDAIAGALVRVGTDEVHRAALIAAGRDRAAALTWKAAARRHVELWEDVT